MIVAEDWIIGYDARVALHSDTPNVMDRKASADTSIWASVFDQGDYPDLSRAERERIGFGTLPLPEWTGINHGGCNGQTHMVFLILWRILQNSGRVKTV